MASNNCINTTTVEKADNRKRAIYNKIDSVLHYKLEKYFLITLEQQLQQLLRKNEIHHHLEEQNLSEQKIYKGDSCK